MFVKFAMVFCTVVSVALIPLILAEMGIDLESYRSVIVMFVVSNLATGNILWQLRRNNG